MVGFFKNTLDLQLRSLKTRSHFLDILRDTGCGKLGVKLKANSNVCGCYLVFHMLQLLPRGGLFIGYLMTCVSECRKKKPLPYVYYVF